MSYQIILIDFLIFSIMQQWSSGFSVEINLGRICTIWLVDNAVSTNQMVQMHNDRNSGHIALNATLSKFGVWG